MKPQLQSATHRVPRPKSFREVPGFLWTVCASFCARVFYAVTLVWETAPWILFAMLAFAILGGVLPVFGAFLSAELLDRIANAYFSQAPDAFDGIVWLLGLQFGYLFVRKLVSVGEHLVTRMSAELVVHHIRRKIMTKAKTVDMASFDSPEFYASLENANREVGNRPIQIINAVFSVFSNLISMISFVVILLAVSPWLPLLMFLISIPGAVVNYIYRRRYFRYMKRESRARREMTYYADLMVNKDVAKEIRTFGLADTFLFRYNTVFDSYFGEMRHLFLREALWKGLLSLFSVLVTGGMFAYVAYAATLGTVTIGDYSLYIGALNSIASGVTSLVTYSATIYEGTLFLDNLRAFLAERQTVVPRIETPRLPERHIAHTIEFRDVSFRYPGSDRDVISHLSVTIPAGSATVLVGLNGAGKTTMLKLLVRLYDPTEGAIYLDGVDLRDYDVSSLYAVFGMIFQDFGKYAATVGDNIAFGNVRRTRTTETLDTAATLGGADSLVKEMPDGYDTQLTRYFDNSATELSGGQWQKLAISRAFYSDADVLLLDEPTASLDPLAEQEIWTRFEKLRAGKTTIFVSHRLSSAVSAEKIIVLAHGRVAEEGTHETLMAARGKYFELFTVQAQKYLSAEKTEERT